MAYWERMLDCSPLYEEPLKALVVQVMTASFRSCRSIDVCAVLHSTPILSNARFVHVLMVVAKVHYGLELPFCWVVFPYLTRFFGTYRVETLLMCCRHLLMNFLDTSYETSLYDRWHLEDVRGRHAVYDVVFVGFEERCVLQQVLRSLIVIELHSIDYDWSHAEGDFGKMYASQYFLARSKLFGYRGLASAVYRPARARDVWRVQPAIEVPPITWINSRIHDEPARID